MCMHLYMQWILYFIHVGSLYFGPSATPRPPSSIHSTLKVRALHKKDAVFEALIYIYIYVLIYLIYLFNTSKYNTYTSTYIYIYIFGSMYIKLSLLLWSLSLLLLFLLFIIIIYICVYYMCICYIYMLNHNIQVFLWGLCIINWVYHINGPWSWCFFSARPSPWPIFMSNRHGTRGQAAGTPRGVPERNFNRVLSVHTQENTMERIVSIWISTWVN